MKKKMLLCVTLVLVLICCMLGTVGVFAGDNVFAVFQDAASLNSWTCPGGVTASFDAGENAAKFSVDAAGGVKRISYNQADLVFSKGARYHEMCIRDRCARHPPAWGRLCDRHVHHPGGQRPVGRDRKRLRQAD